MRTHRVLKLAALAALLLALPILAGCPNRVELTENDKYVIAYDTYAATMRALAVARDAGKLTTAERREITNSSNLALGLLDDWQDVIDRGGDSTAVAASLRALTARLGTYLETHQ